MQEWNLNQVHNLWINKIYKLFTTHSAINQLKISNYVWPYVANWEY